MILYRTLKKMKRYILYYKILKKYKKMSNINIEQQKLISNNFELSLDRISKVKIGKELMVNTNVAIRCRENAELTIGERVFFNNNCVLTCRKKIFIGNNVNFGPNVLIFHHDHNFRDPHRNNKFICDEIVIEKNVWVGGNVCILKGSHIGENSVIAAGAVVNCNVPSNSIYYSKDKIRPI